MATNAAVSPAAATEHSNETLLSELPNQEEGETCAYDATLASVAPSAAATEHSNETHLSEQCNLSLIHI